jgi:hypothetical protein
MDIELLPLDDLEADSKRYLKGIKLTNKVRVDYSTSKHVSFIVEGEENEHNVMYFTEKPGSKKWQCDCKWYTLQNKICSHIIAVNLAIKKSKVSL